MATHRMTADFFHRRDLLIFGLSFYDEILIFLSYNCSQLLLDAGNVIRSRAYNKSSRNHYFLSLSYRLIEKNQGCLFIAMEFPHLGANCAVSSCNRLDFLPVKCDSCHTVFCSDHFGYAAHECTGGGRRDVQVPECPLCGVPVPGRRGEPPDVAVGAHLDRDCKVDRKKVFQNRCSQAGCRVRELVALRCGECGLNYCLRHRHSEDHTCAGPDAARRRQVADAAENRLKQASTPSRPPPVRVHAATVAAIQGNMSEDEALAHALSLSMQPQQQHSTPPARCALS